MTSRTTTTTATTPARLIGRRDDTHQVAVTFFLSVAGAMCGLMGAIAMHGI